MANTGVTLVEVRAEAMDTIRMLKQGKIDVKTAQTIKGCLDTVIDTAKTQVEFLKAVPKAVKDQLTAVEVKAIAGTLKDRDAELDATFHEIEERNKIPYGFGRR
jgi:hypothetical protein